MEEIPAMSDFKVTIRVTESSDREVDRFGFSGKWIDSDFDGIIHYCITDGCLQLYRTKDGPFIIWAPHAWKRMEVIDE
jgi:hypothetical protein